MTHKESNQMDYKLTPLKALQNIKLKLMRTYDGSVGMNGNVMFEKEIPVIETALKDYEKQKQLVQTLQDKIYVKEMKYAKQEKVFEIIKEHKLLNYVLKNEKCANMYHLSKEEKDLLRDIMERKEVVV